MVFPLHHIEIEPVTAVEQLNFHIETDDYLHFSAMIATIAIGEIEEGDYAKAIDFLIRLRNDLIYIQGLYSLVKR